MVNIFVLDKDSQISAKYLCDKHIVKMILEHFQILSTCLHICNELSVDEKELLFKPTHINHPCNIWVRESLANYKWLLLYTQYMLCEYTRRYGKVHSCYSMFRNVFSYVMPNIPNIPMTPFAQCMPEQYKNEDVVEAYRSYYIGEKHFARWKNGDMPYWYE